MDENQQKPVKKSILNKYWHLQNLGMTITTSVPPPPRHSPLQHPEMAPQLTPHCTPSYNAASTLQQLLRSHCHNCNIGAAANGSLKCTMFSSVPQHKHRLFFSFHFLFCPYLANMKKEINHVIFFPFLHFLSPNQK